MRKKWMIFAAVQFLGEVCFWTWGYVAQSALGLFLWGTALVTLFPGNVLSGVVVEKLFWGSRVTVFQMTIIAVPIEIAINVGIWLLCMKLCKFVRTR